MTFSKKQIGDIAYYAVLVVLVGYIIYSGKYQFFYGVIKSRIVKRDTTEIEWYTSFSEAKQLSYKEGKPLFVLLTAPDWCMPCQALEATTLQSKRLITLLNRDFISLRVTDTHPDIKKFTFKSYPSMLVYSADGEEILRISDFVGDRLLISKLQKLSK